MLTKLPSGMKAHDFFPVSLLKKHRDAGAVIPRYMADCVLEQGMLKQSVVDGKPIVYSVCFTQSILSPKPRNTSHHATPLYSLLMLMSF